MSMDQINTAGLRKMLKDVESHMLFPMPRINLELYLSRDAPTYLRLLDALDAKDATIADRDAEIQRLRARNTELEALFQPADDGEPYPHIEQYVNLAAYNRLQADYARLTAELAAMRERCAWVPVAELLPDKNIQGWFMVWADGHVELRFWYGWEHEHEWADVTHWMHQPQPPSAEKGADNA